MIYSPQVVLNRNLRCFQLNNPKHDHNELTNEVNAPNVCCFWNGLFLKWCNEKHTDVSDHI